LMHCCRSRSHTGVPLRKPCRRHSTAWTNTCQAKSNLGVVVADLGTLQEPSAPPS
jgi:hypothetical protein